MSEAAVDEFGFAAGPWIEGSLDDVSTRLDRALLRARSSALSFDVGMPEAERDLLGTLASFGEAPVSFATELGAELDTGLEDQADDAERVTCWLERLLEAATNAAVVETRIQDRLVASTRVGLVGDVTSSVGPAASAKELAEHSITLDRALQVRRWRMQLVLSIVQASAKIAAVISAANPLAALLAAWRFVRSVVREWQARRQ